MILNTRNFITSLPAVIAVLLALNLPSIANERRISDPPWPAYHHDAQRTGRTGALGPNTNAVRWRFAADSFIASSPAIAADGTIYVGAWDSKLYALNPDGSLKWTYAAGSGIVSSPTLGGDGTIYFGAYDNKVYALSPDGTKLWEFATDDFVTSSPLIGSDGTVYVGSWDNNLYAINPDGSEKWRFSTDSFVSSSPALGLDGTIYVGSWDNNLYAVNPDGSEKWHFTTESAVSGSPAVGADGTVYIGSWDGTLYAVDPDGSLTWSYTTNGFIRSSPALASDGTVYIDAAWDGGFNDVLYAISPLMEATPASAAGHSPSAPPCWPRAIRSSHCRPWTAAVRSTQPAPVAPWWPSTRTGPRSGATIPAGRCSRRPSSAPLVDSTLARTTAGSTSWAKRLRPARRAPPHRRSRARRWRQTPPH